MWGKEERGVSYLCSYVCVCGIGQRQGIKPHTHTQKGQPNEADLEPQEPGLDDEGDPRRVHVRVDEGGVQVPGQSHLQEHAPRVLCLCLLCLGLVVRVAEGEAPLPLVLLLDDAAAAVFLRRCCCGLVALLLLLLGGPDLFIRIQSHG